MFPHSRINDVIVIRPKGHLDIFNATAFKNWVKDMFINGGERKVVIDLSEVKSIDSFALGVIVSLYKSLVLDGGKLVLVDGSESVRKIITITSLDKIIPLIDDVKRALEVFG